MRNRVTLAQIAKVAKVHQTTVSLVMRNHPRIPPGTAARIRAVAEKMGYRPDPFLGALVSYRRNILTANPSAVLAYITGWETEWSWREVPAHRRFYEGAVKRANELGFKLEHFWRGEKHLSQKRLSDILKARGIQGVIVASQTPAIDRRLEIDWASFSVVKIDNSPKESPLHEITNDQRTIVQLAYERAWHAGYRRIGFVMPSWWDHYVNLAWSAGYLAAQNAQCDSARLPILIYESPTPTSANDARIEVPEKLFQRWWEQHRPDVVISYKPFVWNTMQSIGIVVPTDIAYADIFLESTDGKMAGVVNNCERVGGVAVEIVAGQLSQFQFGLPDIPTKTNVEGTWVDGDTMPRFSG